jgi:hypothetical protein
VPDSENATGDAGKKAAARVVGQYSNGSQHFMREEDMLIF